jgi:hypothetical protein
MVPTARHQHYFHPVCTFHTPANEVLHKMLYAKRSGTFKGHFWESVSGPTDSKRARGRLALLTNETAAGGSLRHRRTQQSLFENVVM